MHTGKVIKILRKTKTRIWCRPQFENGNNTETVHTIRRAAAGVRFPRAFEK